MKPIGWPEVAGPMDKLREIQVLRSRKVPHCAALHAGYEAVTPSR
jgi:hypothetical protein